MKIPSPLNKVPGFRSGKWWKMIVAVFGYAAIINIIMIPFGSLEGEKSWLAAAVDGTEEKPLIEYTIADREDLSINKVERGSVLWEVTRFTYRVTVPETASEDDMVAIAKALVEDERKSGDVSALTAFFYHPGDALDAGYTAGRVVYAPNGNIADAPDVRPGNYRSHEYKFSPSFL